MAFMEAPSEDQRDGKLDMSSLIDIIAGARPNFMKVAPIIHAMRSRSEDGGRLRWRLVHTGQHYDARMSDAFFEQLRIPAPDVHLGVGSGTHAQQTAAIMTAYEGLLMQERADACLVVGDVNSTMACAIAAQKLHVPVAHVEGGLRSHDWSMPEEINRRVTDSITNWFFTTSRHANDNLWREGVEQERIFLVGNTMIDTLLANLPHLRPPPFAGGLEKGKYIVLTLHRPANVDDEGRLRAQLEAVADHAQGLDVVFPVHPRTHSRLQGIRELPENLLLVEPQPYLEFIWLVKHALGVVTDSGGITEETTVLGVPCMTLRDNTERPETVETGTNELLGTDPTAIPPAMERLLAGRWKKGAIPDKWDGKAARRIVGILEDLLA